MCHCKSSNSSGNNSSKIYCLRTYFDRCETKKVNPSLSGIRGKKEVGVSLLIIPSHDTGSENTCDKHINSFFFISPSAMAKVSMVTTESYSKSWQHRLDMGVENDASREGRDEVYQLCHIGEKRKNYSCNKKSSHQNQKNQQPEKKLCINKYYCDLFLINIRLR